MSYSPLTRHNPQRASGQFLPGRCTGFNAHRRFDSQAFESWSAQLLAQRQLALIGLGALAVNEAIKKTAGGAGVVMISHEGEIIVELSRDSEPLAVAQLRSQLQQQLSASFPGAAFRFSVEQTATL